MKHFLVSLGLFAGMLALVPTEASAVVCARGIYRAGCVGPNGAVGVRRGIYGPRVGMYGRGARGVAFRRYGFRGGFRRW